jgi:hypothetical protein
MSKDFEQVTYANPHAGDKGRDGGPYLDQVERRNAETYRAIAEGHAPNYEEATFTAGVPAVTMAALRYQENVLSHPSMLNQDSTNDGTETLPVSVGTVAPEDGDSLSAKGEGFVKGGEDSNAKDVTVVSALTNDPKAVPAAPNASDTTVPASKPAASK